MGFNTSQPLNGYSMRRWECEYHYGGMRKNRKWLSLRGFRNLCVYFFFQIFNSNSVLSILYGILAFILLLHRSIFIIIGNSLHKSLLLWRKFSNYRLHYLLTRTLQIVIPFNYNDSNQSKEIISIKQLKPVYVCN